MCNSIKFKYHIRDPYSLDLIIEIDTNYMVRGDLLKNMQNDIKKSNLMGTLLSDKEYIVDPWSCVDNDYFGVTNSFVIQNGTIVFQELPYES